MSREKLSNKVFFNLSSIPLAGGILFFTMLFLLCGCSICDYWCPYPDTEKPHITNHNPKIKYIYAEQDKKRVRSVAPGAKVIVVASAEDADKDNLQYRWKVAPESGTLEESSGTKVIWQVGTAQAYQTVQLIVTDGKGGRTQAKLRVSTGPKFVFSGQIISVPGDGVPFAEIELNGQDTIADKNGFFNLPIEKPNADRFLFNVRKPGYGLISRIYDHIVIEGKWVMTRATSQRIDPSVANILRDVRSRENCQGPMSAKINWHLFPNQRVPKMFGSSGEPVGGYPPQLREAVDFILNGTECSPGISLQLPANTLVDGQGKPPDSDLDIAVSTVDIFAPSAMPGDYTVQLKEGTAVMQSYGAGTVAVTGRGREYQIKPGSSAILTIPVDPSQLKQKAKIPPSIPLLLYNPETSSWTQTSIAKLNAKGDAYVGEVTHFSEFNMDLIKTDQSCVRVDASALPGNFEMDIVVPMGGAAPVVRHKIISEELSQDEPRLHTLYNLPSNTWIALIPIHDVGGSLVPYGIFGVNTGPAQVPTDPNRPDYPYGACRSEVALFDAGGHVSFEVDGTDDHSAPLPQIIYNLVDTGGTDIYPVGGSEYYIFSLFDTGSDIVLINEADATTLLMGASSPGNTHQDVDVRINGLNGIDPVSLNAGIYEPGGPGGAQAEVENIRVGIRDFPLSLIGSPVATQVVALIDNTTMVTRGPYGFCGGCSFDGPDITFFTPGDPGIPNPHMALEMERFGTAGVSGTDNAARDQRFLLRNITFENDGNAVDDDRAAADPRYFSFDTGSRAIIISSDMATALGIDIGLDGFEDCWTDAGHPGNEMYKVDTIIMTNPDGSIYKVLNASVCVDKLDDKIITHVTAGNKVDAVLGMNAFMQVPVTVNGPANTLGIGIAETP